MQWLGYISHGSPTSREIVPFKTIRNENALPKANEGLEAPPLPTNGVAQHLGTWVRLVEHQTHATKTQTQSIEIHT